jgi:CRP/FNR family transcriptional regulator
MTSFEVSPTAVKVLSYVPCFAALDAATLEALAQIAVLRQYDAGQTIYLEGEPATAMFVLQSGWVKAARLSRAGREQALRFVRPVDIFGDVAILTGTAYPATVLALEDVQAWAIEGTAFLDSVARHPSLALAMNRHLAQRILYFTSLVEDLSLRSVEARLALTLLKNTEAQDGQIVVPRREWTTFDEMATRLGTVREVLSRALHALEQEGLLRVERRQIVVLDPEALARRGEAE